MTYVQQSKFSYLAVSFQSANSMKYFVINTINQRLKGIIKKKLVPMKYEDTYF